MCQDLRLLYHTGHIPQAKVHPVKHVSVQLLFLLCKLRQFKKDISHSICQQPVMSLLIQPIYRPHIRNPGILLKSEIQDTDNIHRTKIKTVFSTLHLPEYLMHRIVQHPLGITILLATLQFYDHLTSIIRFAQQIIDRTLAIPPARVHLLIHEIDMNDCPV